MISPGNEARPDSSPPSISEYLLGPLWRVLFRRGPAKPTGRYRSISPFRHLVSDLMYLSADIPCATLERRMDLSRLCQARAACKPAPTWSGIFAKAFARVSAATPALRTAHLGFPWPRFYEHFKCVATINVDRQLADERIILFAHIPNPQDLRLDEIDALIRYHQKTPVEEIACYCRSVRLSHIPWPFRRRICWAALNIFGSFRCDTFGTFGISTVGSQGAGILHLLPIVTSSIHYGVFDRQGTLDVRLSFDHRVLDGATVAQALADLEGVLLGEITDECAQRAKGSALGTNEALPFLSSNDPEQQRSAA